MNPHLRILIELQKLDDVIRLLEAEVAALPRRIAEIKSTLTIHIQQVEADQAALAENQKSRRRREGEIAAARDKISHFKEQSLMVKTNEQYKALLHEIDHQEVQIRKTEDLILSEMMESESLEETLRGTEARLAEERRQAAAEIAAAEQRKHEDEEKLAEARSERSALRDQLPQETYENYERIVKARKGQAVAAVIDGTCGACHVHLRPQVFSEVMSNELLHTCESCGRILYYVPVPAAPPDEETAASPQTDASGGTSR